MSMSTFYFKYPFLMFCFILSVSWIFSFLLQKRHWKRFSNYLIWYYSFLLPLTSVLCLHYIFFVLNILFKCYIRHFPYPSITHTTFIFYENVEQPIRAIENHLKHHRFLSLCNTQFFTNVPLISICILQPNFHTLKINKPWKTLLKSTQKSKCNSWFLLMQHCSGTSTYFFLDLS